jgi:hypothetical protein
MSEDIIEDITEEALLEDQELVQDTSAEEVTEQQGYSETIEGILLGEGKKSKTESDEEESEEDESEEEEEMEESAKPKKEESDEEDSEEEEEEVEESVIVSQKPTNESKKEESEEEEVEEEEEEMEESTVNEDLSILIQSEANLTEDFKAKASTLFEAAVSQKVVAERERLAEEYANDLVEEVTEVRESLITKIDDYLSYVVESWVEDNQVAVDSKLRTDIAEGFIGSLKQLFVENYIEVPECKVDLFDEMSEEVQEVKDALALSESTTSELQEKVEVLSRKSILSEQSSDLAATQVAKLEALTEEVEFVSESVFAEKVATIKSSMFASNSKSEEIVLEENNSKSEIIVEGQVDSQAELSSDMKSYLSAITSQIK